MASPALGPRLAEHDPAAFVGRRAELATLAGWLAAGSAVDVGFVHGPGGIGKSTLVREFARRAGARFELRWIEGRELPPVPEAIEDAIGEEAGNRPLLLVLDSFERIAGTGGYLRRVVLPNMPFGSAVVIVSRAQPDESWFEGGLDMNVLELGPLPDGDARALARAGGVSVERAGEFAVWAGGSPLALTLATSAHAEDRAFRPHSAVGERRQLVGELIRRVAVAEFEGRHWSALAVAAIARSVTPEMLLEVLPDRDASGEYAWLAGRAFTEPLGEGVALHHVVGEALRAELRRRDPERERELRRRIADHLYERASRGDLLLAIDLSHLIESTAIRWGYSAAAGANYHLDDPREGDVDVFDTALSGGRHSELWRVSRGYFERTPEHVAVVRDRDETPLGYTVAVTPATAPAAADGDPVLGPRLEHARGLGADETTVVFRDMVDLSRDPALHVVGMLGQAGMLRASLANPRYAYLIINPALGGATDFAAALGARHLPSLDAEVGEITLECHLLDHGLGGMVAHEREVVYTELQLAPPERREPSDAVTEAVRAALRDVDDSAALARSELASGATVEERAGSVLTLLLAIADRAFGTEPGEELLRCVLVEGCLDRAADHGLVAERLGLSRPQYFRRLRAASERLANYITVSALRQAQDLLRAEHAGGAAEAVVRDASVALAERDYRALTAVAHVSIEISASSRDGVRRTYTGHAGLARYLEELAPGGQRIEIQYHQTRALDSERVLVSGRMRIWERRGLTDSPYSWLWTVSAGRVAAIEVFAGGNEAR